MASTICIDHLRCLRGLPSLGVRVLAGPARALQARGQIIRRDDIFGRSEAVGMQKAKPGWLAAADKRRGGVSSVRSHGHGQSNGTEKKQAGGRKSKWAEYIALSTVPLVMVLGN